MNLTVSDIAKMIDLSCVRTISSKEDIEKMVINAKKYKFGQVSVLQCFIPLTKALIIDDPSIRLVGNVSFPSGSDSTTTKIFQAKEMKSAGCDEIDMVINVGKLRSGEIEEVTEDVKAVVSTVYPIPVKVIIETPYLTPGEIETASRICVESGAAFVKTGTGWSEKGTSFEDIRLIKTVVGNRIQIKASGGIRDVKTLLEMYKLGARRFGVNLTSGIQIVEDCVKNPEILAGFEKDNQ
jgi:deoxyribose-phosphate aldolase